ncbi:hypothetical protein [Raineyella sp. W15-4]|uniref:hypothetical protein n=1 Tax=Raineyella sp. W15-4 TaxID=3081651 RepID=UPI002953C168|nr:hypothetical protein [Raineyella sp. W15-4]WOQ15583.1 hypothetical protein R0145_10035 [Raineyella sp. W15-4]
MAKGSVLASTVHVDDALAPRPGSVVRRGVIPHGGGFWIVALAFLTEMAFCAVSTPLCMRSISSATASRRSS